MKKILLILIPILILTGCGKNLNKQYEDMQIGNIESYQLDLRIYGKENKMIKIDNYKNEEFKIITNDDTYYVLNGITYKETENKETKYEKVDEKVFTNTDLLLQALKNIKAKKEIDNDIKGLDLKLYEVTIDSNYIKSLLKELGYSEEYSNITSKIYLQNNTIYRIEHKIDDLKISATFFRVNNIKKSNINFE